MAYSGSTHASCTRYRDANDITGRLFCPHSLQPLALGSAGEQADGMVGEVVHSLILGFVKLGSSRFTTLEVAFHCNCLAWGGYLFALFPLQCLARARSRRLLRLYNTVAFFFTAIFSPWEMLKTGQYNPIRHFPSSYVFLQPGFHISLVSFHGYCYPSKKPLFSSIAVHLPSFLNQLLRKRE